MIMTGFTAVAISLTTLSDPIGTHPHLADHPVFANPRAITNIFGWMMLYLATLTVNLAWQGWLSLRNKQNHLANRAWHNLLSQALLTVASANCFVRGATEPEPMMMGIAMVGFATVATNLWFIYKPYPLPTDRIKSILSAWSALASLSTPRSLPLVQCVYYRNSRCNPDFGRCH